MGESGKNSSETKDSEVKIKQENFGFPEAKRKICFKRRMVSLAKCFSEIKKGTDQKLTMAFANGRATDDLDRVSVGDIGGEASNK